MNTSEETWEGIAMAGGALRGAELIELHITWMRRRDLGERTIYQRRGRLTATDETIGLTTATPESIEDMLDRRTGRGGKRISPRTRRNWLSHLSGFYGWAVDWDHLERDPTRKIVRPRLSRLLPRPIDELSLARAVDASVPMVAAWLTLAAYAGLRCAEISTLDREDVLDDNRVLRILGKGNKERIVPMHDVVLSALHQHGLPDHGLVFTQPNGSEWSPTDISRHGAMHLRTLGIEATMHQLRHRFATQVYSECTDLRVTQELMGHADPATTAIYVDYDRDTARRAVEGLRTVGRGAA